jgi:hypothetical protein
LRLSGADATVAERDALAAEVASVYPALAAQLADIVGRIAANGALIEQVNRRSLPEGARGLASAEAVARGLPGNFVAGGFSIPQLTRDLRLPATPQLLKYFSEVQPFVRKLVVVASSRKGGGG